MTGQLNLHDRHLALLQALLAKHVPHAVVWAFGSRLSGTGHECSDLDLALRHPEDPSAPVQGLATLREALRESTLPFLVDVHDWARLPETFRREIEKSHMVLRGAGAPSGAVSNRGENRDSKK